jgi:hypothetical protein
MGSDLPEFRWQIKLGRKAIKNLKKLIGLKESFPGTAWRRQSKCLKS